MRTTLRRVAAVAAGSVLALTGMSSSPASADSTPSSTSATTWLAGELTGGLMHNPNFGGFDDYGLSIDTAFAELASGNTAVAGQIRDAMASHVDDYLTFGDPNTIYAGAAAKALVFAQRTGADPTTYGGRNLVTTTEGRISSSAGSEGRLVDMFSPPSSDSANAIGQSFAVRGLNAASSAKAATATSYLLRQQCPAGFFRLALGDAQCADNTSPDTDVTALAVLSLEGQGTKPEVAAAIAKATTWLLSTQASDGSFGGGGVTAAANTNSTGLAASALGEQCQVTAANRAANYVRGFQVPAGQTGPLGTEVGAVAYDTAAKTLGQTQGITDASSDQWRRATTQAAPGLTWDSNATATVQVSAPKGFIKGGESAKVTIAGAAVGERVCVTDSNGGVAILTGTGSPLIHHVHTAKNGKDVTVSATTGPGSATDEIQVLGKVRLKPRLAKSVTQGDKVVVKVKKLGAKEKVKLFVDGKLVAKGKATKKGIFVGRFVARFKVGTHQLKAVGQFKNRVGATTFRVVG
jgi:hypothetical protein